MSAEQVAVKAMAEEIARLKAENAALASRKVNARLKVSEKGAVSVYGIHSRFPVTLYGNQWVTLLGMAQEIQEFMRVNQDKLARKQ